MQGRRQPWERPEERRRLGEPPSSGGSSRDSQLVFGGFLPSPACYDTSLSSKHRQKGETGKPSLAWARGIGGARAAIFSLFLCRLGCDGFGANLPRGDENANAVDSVDHSHIGLARKLHVSGNVALMNQVALDEYSRFAVKGGTMNEARGKQFARLVMSYVDCDTIPFLWQYASRFVLFDNIFATEDSPSTPNAVAMISGQAGETRWVKHGPNGRSYIARNQPGTIQAPLVTDPEPFHGSQFDSTVMNREPAGAKEPYQDNDVATNLTFASLPLTLLGRNAKAVMSQDIDQKNDLSGIKPDIEFIASHYGKSVAWRWYEVGYDREPTDNAATASHDSYISHHEAPQFFGYIANNPALRGNFRGLDDFFTDMAAGALPPDGGVFYLRGGYANIAKQEPYVRPGTPPTTPERSGQ
jgi:phospholipase C